MFRILNLALIIFVSWPLWSESSEKPTIIDAKEVSIFQLIAIPERYENKIIEVLGYSVFDQERPALYATKDAYEYFDYRSGIYLINTNRLDVQHCQRQYCRVSGRFSETLGGNPGIFSGYLVIETIDSAPSVKERKNLSNSLH